MPSLPPAPLPLCLMEFLVDGFSVKMVFANLIRSPPISIIIADILQQLIIKANNDGLLFHPLCPHLPCPVLQYADDTLIIVKASPDATKHLKAILDDFAAATGLQINFSKTTFIPLNVTPGEAATLAADLATDIASFPQTYLDLPLSPHKLPPSAFQPVIDRCDTYLT
uniref:Reverse transcriptase domain-containing protein n=1 Tax=Triticum urartu TaxID=4572 RepID=A0A8R7V5F8_TRIUA